MKLAFASNTPTSQNTSNRWFQSTTGLCPWWSQSLRNSKMKVIKTKNQVGYYIIWDSWKWFCAGKRNAGATSVAKLARVRVTARNIQKVVKTNQQHKSLQGLFSAWAKMSTTVPWKATNLLIWLPVYIIWLSILKVNYGVGAYANQFWSNLLRKTAKLKGANQINLIRDWWIQQA
jgi:hypothetical protein